MNSQSYNKIKILITRPAGQQHAFARHCNALGLKTLHLPCLSIEYLCSESITETLSSASDIVLFTSANAVRSAQKHRPFPWPDVTVHAIGQATAGVLESFQQAVTLVPAAPHNSEAYIESVRHQPRQPLLIIKGRGGRTLIYDALLRSGWSVSQIDVYQRACPRLEKSVVDEVFSDGRPDLVSVTSDEVLTNLLIMTKQHQPALFQSQLIVNSERCAEKAISAGFSREPLVSNPPGDAGQLNCIERWLQTTMCDR